MNNHQDFPSVPPPLIRQNAEAVDGNPGPQEPYSSDEEDKISVFFNNISCSSSIRNNAYL